MFSNYGRPSSKTKSSLLFRRLGSCFTSRVWSIAAATVAAALVPAVASASLTSLSVLQLPSFFLRTGNVNDFQTFTDPGTYTVGAVTAILSDVPSASLTGHVDGRTGVVNDMDSGIDYAFSVEGPVDGFIVPMIISTHLSARAIGSQFVDVNALVDLFLKSGLPNSRFVLVAVINASNHNLAPAPIDVDFRFDGLTGLPGEVSMRAFVSTTGGGTGDAFVDPFIFIDPDFMKEHPRFKVFVSPGIGNGPLNAAGVPEPPTLALFGLGLAGMGLNRRRHPRKS